MDEVNLWKTAFKKVKVIWYAFYFCDNIPSGGNQDLESPVSYQVINLGFLGI